MGHPKRIIYCVSFAAVLTALVLFFIDEGGQALLIPGFLLELGLAVFVVIDPEEILFTSQAWGGNILVYSIASYGLSCGYGNPRRYFSRAKSSHASCLRAMHASQVIFLLSA